MDKCLLEFDPCLPLSLENELFLADEFTHFHKTLVILFDFFQARLL